MPSKTPAQHKLMEAVAHSMKPRKGGPSKAVAEEFVAADARRPNGQMQGTRETQGKMNGGGHGQPVHPQNHQDFEKL